MAQVSGLLDPLNSIIEPEISDGSDALLNSSAPDDEEVRREKKAFMIDNSWRSYRYYETHVCATAALGHTMKPYNVFSDCRAAHIILLSHVATSCVYLLPPGVWVGWRGFSLPVRVSSRGTDGAYGSLLDDPEACSRKPLSPKNVSRNNA